MNLKHEPSSKLNRVQVGMAEILLDFWDCTAVYDFKKLQVFIACIICLWVTNETRLGHTSYGKGFV